ncbi:MAG: hypothetical protein LBT84_01495 [Spirochaetia bacterium]|jgi:hypothetical protein|nr:hypothetical protein [Spirochaetia bacterium]
MARNLTFSLKGTEYSASPLKIDRKKLYGWTTTMAFDDNENLCTLAQMDETGTIIIPKGGTGLGILSPEKKWVARSELKAVTETDGSDAQLIPSTYSGTIALETTVSSEEFLNHSITGFYQLTGADPALIEAAKDSIYTFLYSYKDSYEGSCAFLIESGGALFMLVGYKSEFEMLSLNQTGIIDDAPDEEDDAASDEIDFSMF